MGQRGFTLIEMIIVVAIIGIFITAAYPLLGSANSRDADNMARQLTADLQWMQQLSINTIPNGPFPMIEFTTNPVGYVIKLDNQEIKPRVVFPNTMTVTPSSNKISLDVNGRCNLNKTNKEESITLKSGKVYRKIVITKIGQITTLTR